MPLANSIPKWLDSCDLCYRIVTGRRIDLARPSVARYFGGPPMRKRIPSTHCNLNQESEFMNLRHLCVYVLATSLTACLVIGCTQAPAGPQEPTVRSTPIVAETESDSQPTSDFNSPVPVASVAADR